MDYPVEFMVLKSYDEAPTHIQMYNKSQIDDIVTVYIPPEMAPVVSLVSMDLILPTNSIASVNITTIVRDGQKPWLQIPASLLEITAGYHSYKLTFHDNVINTNVNRYLDYIIQDNKPDKSYYYMDKPVSDDGSQSYLGPNESQLD